MKITIKTQKEFDNISDDFEGIIYLRNGRNLIIVNRKFKNGHIYACDNSNVIVNGNNSVTACNDSSVEAYENSLVEAYDNSSVEAYDNSSVIACGNSYVIAYDNSSVRTYGNSSVRARDNSSVYAKTDSSVEARDDTSIMAYGNSLVMAYDNSSVFAFENSSVVVNGYSSVIAHGYSSVVANDINSVELFGWSQCKLMSKNVKYKTFDHARVILPFENIQDYIEYFGIKEDGDNVILYKAVHKINNRYVSDYDNSYKYIIGKKSVEKAVTDITVQCTKGLHASYLQWALDYGRNWDDLAILEVEIAKKDCVVPEFSDGKIRTGKLKVIREVPKEEWMNRK